MKRFSISIILIIMAIMTSYGQNSGNVRKPAVAGSFYPADPGQLKKEVSYYLDASGKICKDGIVRAIIVPHAGYIFSAHTAAAAFKYIPENADYDNIFLIGTSHNYAFDGASAYTSGDFMTPLGEVKVNTEICKKLEESSSFFISRDDVHIPEHSLEVQLPFIQCHFNKVIPIVPILIGTGNLLTLQGIAKALQPYFNEKNLFIISSDFSHYPSYDDATRVDKMTMEAIIKGDPDNFIKTVRSIEKSGTDGLATAMCGWSSGYVLLSLTRNEKDLVFNHLEYTNSGNSTYGDKTRVVGYNAIAIVQTAGKSQESAKAQGPGFTLTDDEKKTLLKIARNAIKSKLFNESVPQTDPAKLSPTLKEPLGAFVTLTIDGQLRGCIGRFMPSEPLYTIVESMAVAAAFSDTRFTPLTKAEYPKIEIEISVLGPLHKIKSIDEIVIGKHGVYVKKGMRSGTLLPQVPDGRGWTVEDFLGYTSRDKAGIGWKGWQDKDAEIYTYEAVVFHE
jgi:MEMO1 family protein